MKWLVLKLLVSLVSLIEENIEHTYLLLFYMMNDNNDDNNKELIHQIICTMSNCAKHK